MNEIKLSPERAKALAIAKDIFLVQMNGRKAYEAMQAEFEQRDQELRKRTSVSSQELMDDLFREVGLDPADKKLWAIDLRYIDAHDFGIMYRIDPESGSPLVDETSEPVKQ